MLYVYVALLLGLLLCLVPVVVWRLGKRKRGVCVVVLGDLGRSPRMQYHSISLADAGFVVDVVGYGGSDPLVQLRQHSSDNVSIVTLGEPFEWLQARYVPPLFRYGLKAVCQHVQLMVVLVLWTRRPAHFLLQSPPAIPLLSAVWLICLLTGSRMIIDWHNYGYSILQLALKPQHPLVSISKWYECFFGRCAATNICVTKAMREDLADNWGIRAVTMYDRPPLMFKPATIQQSHELFLRLSTKYPVFRSESSSLADGVKTAFTMETNGNVKLRSDRPFLIISSTSWTEDEDFSVLLEALESKVQLNYVATKCIRDERKGCHKLYN